MFVFIIISCMIAVGIGTEIPAQSHLNERIVGRYNYANVGQFPYQISIRYKNNNFHFCGGSIISSLWIVTAGHCVYEKNTNDLQIVVGGLGLTDLGTTHQIQEIKINPNYVHTGLHSDIALIKLQIPIEFNNVAKPILISRDPIENDVWGILTGWGQTSNPENYPETLQYLWSKTLNEHLPECSGYKMCILALDGQGLCFGDSGGPYAVNGNLVGIISAAVPCAFGYADTVTRVSYFSDWIYRETGVYPLSENMDYI